MKKFSFFISLLLIVSVSFAQNKSGVTTTEKQNADGSKTITMKMDCMLCSGSGIWNCSCCAGLGGRKVLKDMVYIGYSYTPIYDYLQCQCCGGSGKATCSLCGGKGYTVSTSTYWPDAPDNENFGNSCHKCRGTATCQDCYGSGTKINPATGNTLQCTYCKGSGKCWLCKGTGKKGQ